MSIGILGWCVRVVSVRRLCVVLVVLNVVRFLGEWWVLILWRYVLILLLMMCVFVIEFGFLVVYESCLECLLLWWLIRSISRFGIVLWRSGV